MPTYRDHDELKNNVNPIRDRRIIEAYAKAKARQQVELAEKAKSKSKKSGKEGKEKGVEKEPEVHAEQPNVVTLFTEDRMVYVEAPTTFEQLQASIYHHFPQYSVYPQEQLEIKMMAKLGDRDKEVEVSRSAWNFIRTTIREFELVRITLLDEPRVPGQTPKSVLDMPPSYSDLLAPGGNVFTRSPSPKYLELLAAEGSCHSRSRSPSPSLSQRLKNVFKGSD